MSSRTILTTAAVLILSVAAATAQTSGGGAGGTGGGAATGGAASTPGSGAPSSGITAPVAPSPPPAIGSTQQQPGTVGQQGIAPQMPSSTTPGRGAPASPYGSQSTTPGAGVPGQGTLNQPGINSRTGAGSYPPATGSNSRTGNAGTGLPTDRSSSGGGGNTLADCMSFWDKDTHMTKAEWRATCIRSKNALDQTPLGNGKTATPRKSRRVDRR